MTTMFLKTTQRNNHTVALSVLRSAAAAFLQFEKSFKSLLSKGDDSTQLYILRKCVDELREANKSFQEVMNPLSMHLSWLIFEPTSYTNMRELFEQCIKVLGAIMPLLGSRDVNTHAHEFLVQTYGWKGWQQQSEIINLSNNALGLVLQRVCADEKDESFSTQYQEIWCFQKTVNYVTECFFHSSYPQKAQIEKIYASGNVIIAPYLVAIAGPSGSTTTSGGGNSSRQQTDNKSGAGSGWFG